MALSTDSWHIEALGGADDEDPHAYLVTMGPRCIQIDAGVVSKARADIVVVTHAHRNRVCALGNLENAVVVETEATRSLRHAFPDAYLDSTVLSGVGWHEVFGGGPRIGLLDSGHLPGAVAVVVDDGAQSVVWGGDIGWFDRPGLAGISRNLDWKGLKPSVLYLEGPLLEDDQVVDEDSGFDQIVGEAQRSSEDGGRLLIAAAACGRGQYLLAGLGRAMSRGTLPMQEIGVDDLTDSVANRWPGGLACPRTTNAGSASIMVLPTRLLFAGTPSARMAEELRTDPRSRIVIAGGVVEGSPAAALVDGDRPSDWRCSVTQIPFADRLTKRGLEELRDWAQPARVELVEFRGPAHRYRWSGREDR